MAAINPSVPFSLSLVMNKPSVKPTKLPKPIFISEPDDALKCSICLEIAEDPKQEEGCGKLFCSTCIQAWSIWHPDCPICRTTNARYFTDKKSHRDIQRLRVKCSYTDNGCKWEGTMATLKDHMVECGHMIMDCPRGCPAQFLRKDQQNHLQTQCPKRPYKCKDCGQKDTYAVITGQHQDVCQNKILPCPNEQCKTTLERGKMHKHTREFCDYTELSCKYAAIGCSVTKIRREIREHEEDVKHHLSVSLDKIAELTDKLYGRQTTFSISGYQKKMECNYEEPIELIHEYKLHLHVFANGYHRRKGLGITLKLSHPRNITDDQLTCDGTITVELLNQAADNNHLIKTWHLDRPSLANTDDDSSWYCHFYRSMLTQKDALYLVHDTLYFRVTTKLADHKPWLKCTPTPSVMTTYRTHSTGLPFRES